MRSRHNPEQIETLIGGYAGGNLSREEHDALVKAALVNQALFDSLMDEEVLREALADPGARDELLRRLREAPQPRPWWRRPWLWAALSCAAVAALFVIVNDADDTPVERAAAARAAVSVPKPEPLKIPYRAPKKLVLSKPQAPRLALQAAAPKPLETLAPPPDAPVAPPPESATVVLPAPEDLLAMALDANVPATEPLKVVLEFRGSDGVWRQAAGVEPLPPGRPLRLIVTSESAGVLGMEPALAAPRRLEANTRTIISLPARSGGALLLRLSFSSRMPAVISNPAGPVRAAVGPRGSRRRAEASAVQLPPPAAVPQAKPTVIVRDLQLRFQPPQ